MVCRVCGHREFGDVIDLGAVPLANNLTASPDPDCERWELRVVWCRCCSLAQLTETPPPEAMFEDYSYFSSMSRTMVEHARVLVERHVAPGQRVVEVASNDGYLLAHARAAGARILGVDPARNVAAEAIRRGVPTECLFFDERSAQRIRDTFGPADVMFALNVLAHVPDPNQIAAGIKVLLADDGVAHVEVPHMMRLVEHGAFDTIYHEHYSYFSANALARLFGRHDLVVVGVRELPIHGGSLHLEVAHAGPTGDVERHCASEREAGIFDDGYYADFEARVATIKRDLIEEIDRHERVAGLGAAAKATVLLNCCEIGTDRIPWVADITPYKQNRHIPGTGQRIVTPDRLVSELPDACLVFPWNLRDEIVERNRAYLDAGGSFIFGLPEISVVPGRERAAKARRAVPTFLEAPGATP
jgi:SAM-dependent methyltransferase